MFPWTPFSFRLKFCLRCWFLFFTLIVKQIFKKCLYFLDCLIAALGSYNGS